MATTTAPAPAPSTIDRLVDATPDSRDRAVDFLRAFSIVVVVLWHWVFSVTHWNGDGALTMPNPIDGVPLLWLATWFLQVMPLFFFVGGFANFVSYRAHRRAGGSAGVFVRARMRRLWKPVGVFLAVWAGFEVVARAAVPGYPGVLHWGFVVFVPLWFLGVYAGVVACAPLTVRLHERAPIATLVALASAVAVVDLARFGLGVEAIGFANVVFVFGFVHQLGYFYADGSLLRAGRRGRLLLLGASVVGLVGLTTFGPYAHAMVAVDSERISNMMPPNAAIALLGVFQAGVVLVLRPALNRMLARRRMWKAVVAANAVAMTVFTWHMTAYVLAVAAAHLAGHGLLAHPTAAWWQERPLWLLLPGAFLALLVAVFSRFELRTPRPATITAMEQGR